MTTVDERADVDGDVDEPGQRDSERALAALTARLTAVHRALTGADLPAGAQDRPSDSGMADASSDTAWRASILLGELVGRIDASGSLSEIWLLLTGLSASFPLEHDVLDFKRRLELDGPARSSVWLLERGHDLSITVGSPLRDIEIVSNGLVVDVDYVAQHDLHTGIQRVARETLPRWMRTRDVALAAWTQSQAALRGLRPAEQDRVLRWGLPADHTAEDASDRLIVPWRSTLFVPEILQFGPAPHLRSFARMSGNRVVALGYDCIPIASAEAVPDFGSEVFAKYLAALKYADTIIGISSSATAEFRGFGRMLDAQGLPRPTVVECMLPVDAPAAAADVRPADPPLVLCVGSHGPHKNHLAVLYAAEVLWREGRRFELCFVGGSGWMSEDFDARVRHLRTIGRSLSVPSGVPDSELWNLYQRARFTVFPSLHEGFGLPVAESLHFGTPAITSNFGSMREIAELGGALLIDPRDDDQLVESMRRLLADDVELQRLREEARNRPRRTWDDYASELWDLVAPAPDFAAHQPSAGDDAAAAP